jgi:hypothetical protein
LPEELASAEALRERIRAARAKLKPGARINLTDGDVRLMKGRGGYVAGYNAQAMVVPLEASRAGRTGMLMTATRVTDAPDDHGQLVPMLDQAAATIGRRAAVTLADGGYHSGPNLTATHGQCLVMPDGQRRTLTQPYHKDHFAYDATTDTSTCPAGEALTFRGIKHQVDRVDRAPAAACRACPALGMCTTDRRQGRSLEVSPDEAALRAHRTWMATETAQTLYRRRKGLIEPVFGIVKEQQRTRRFLLRGLVAVEAEWSLVAATFNLRTLAGIWHHQPQPGGRPA